MQVSRMPREPWWWRALSAGVREAPRHEIAGCSASLWGFERGGDGGVVGWVARIGGVRGKKEIVERGGTLSRRARAGPGRPVMVSFSVSRASEVDRRGSAEMVADVLGRCHELSMASGGDRAFG